MAKHWFSVEHKNIADKRWPGKYNSDFATQVTSNVEEAQNMTTNFSNNKLNGFSRFADESFPDYKTSRTRICVTVSMMTTGYDCQDLLNIAFLRPIFSPADFIQMKGRGTRKFNFIYKSENIKIPKDSFKLFDFFAVCEFFEKDFKYDEALKLPAGIGKFNTTDPDPTETYGENEVRVINREYNHNSSDFITSIKEEQVSSTGMRVDREAFGARMREELSKDKILEGLYREGDQEGAEDYFKREIYDKPNLFVTRDKVKKGFNLDRLPSFTEIIEYIFKDRENFDSNKEVLQKSWDDFMSINGNMINDSNIDSAYQVFTAYSQSGVVRKIIDEAVYGKLDEHGLYDEWNKLAPNLRIKIPVYARDFVVEKVKS